MFDFGFSELVMIGIVALVVLGPERLPVVARTAGQWLGKAQRMVQQVKSFQWLLTALILKQFPNVMD